MYQDVTSAFNQPCVCLLSPTAPLVEVRNGGLLTLFLHSPLAGVCVLCGIHNPSVQVLHRSVDMMTSVIVHVANNMLSAKLGIRGGGREREKVSMMCEFNISSCAFI